MIITIWQLYEQSYYHPYRTGLECSVEAQMTLFGLSRVPGWSHHDTFDVAQTALSVGIVGICGGKESHLHRSLELQ